MNKRLLGFKIALLAALALLIVLARGSALWSQQKLDQRLSQQTDAPYSPKQLPELPKDDAAVTHYTEMIERPLFLEGRRPVLAENEIDAPENGTTPVVTSGPLAWELVGIYYDGNSLRTLLHATQVTDKEKKYQKLTVDDEIDGWRIVSIETDRVVLDAADEQRVLILQKPKDTKPTSTPAPKSLADADGKKAEKTTPTNPFAAKIAEAQKRLANKQTSEDDEP